MAYAWRRRTSLLALSTISLLFTEPGYSQSSGTPGVSSRSIMATAVDQFPTLDGTLQDVGWQRASVVSEFHQREPFEKQSPTERTEVRILYDRRNLYFGVHCYDSEPPKIVATELRRDADFNVDDNFTILLSPTNDQRNGYTFTINPLGTQFDASISGESRVNDPNWDGVWKSNAKITDGGWTATIAIPFSTLNFKS